MIRNTPFFSKNIPKASCQINKAVKSRLESLLRKSGGKTSIHQRFTASFTFRRFRSRSLVRATIRRRRHVLRKQIVDRRRVESRRQRRLFQVRQYGRREVDFRLGTWVRAQLRRFFVASFPGSGFFRRREFRVQRRQRQEVVRSS